MNKRVNFTSLIGIAFIILAVLRATPWGSFDASFVSSIAMAGLWLIIADLAAESLHLKTTINSLISKMKVHKEKIISKVENDELEEILNTKLNTLDYEYAPPFSLFGKMVPVFFILAVLSITVLPQLKFMKDLNEGTYLFIGDFTVLLGIGLTLVITYIRENNSSILEEFQKGQEDLIFKMSEVTIKQINIFHLRRENKALEEYENVLESYQELLKEYISTIEDNKEKVQENGQFKTEFKD